MGARDGRRISIVFEILKLSGMKKQSDAFRIKAFLTIKEGISVDPGSYPVRLLELYECDQWSLPLHWADRQSVLKLSGHDRRDLARVGLIESLWGLKKESPCDPPLRIEVNKDRPEDVCGEAAHHVQHCRAPKHNPAETTCRLARGGVCRVAGAASHLKLRGNCIDVDEIAANQRACHNEHPSLVMRQGDQPRASERTEATVAPKPNRTSSDGNAQHSSVPSEVQSDR